ncbi:hypothetical protein F4860DRAFT_518936 [Xylaria cubensis]|nr:hypothetical protein F4860DRAFT_518936 [Xylaria cubensis]
MAPGQKMYPRATVKKIVKAHSKCNVSKNVDVMIFLDYVLFMQTLIKEAAIDSKQAGERNVSAKSIRKATPSLRQRVSTSDADHADHENTNPDEKRSRYVEHWWLCWFGGSLDLVGSYNVTKKSGNSGEAAEQLG